MIVDGKVALAQFSDVDRFVPRARACATARRFLRPRRAGDRLPGQEALVEKLFGEEWRSALGRSGASTTATSCANMYVATPQGGYGSSAAAWRSAGFIRNISRCRSGARGGAAGALSHQLVKQLRIDIAAGEDADQTLPFTSSRPDSSAARPIAPPAPRRASNSRNANATARPTSSSLAASPCR